MGVIGYRRLPCSDPEEQRLRDLYHASEGALRQRASDLLAAYLWRRTEAEIAEDRRKHPKAKRNQTHDGPKGEGRLLP